MSLTGLPLTFYGHFSGFSSYPVVCLALARWLLDQGVDLRVCNLRADQMPGWLEAYQVDPSLRASIWNCAVGSKIVQGIGPAEPDRPDAIGMLFGFPQWLSALPCHRTMIGYHVGDVRPLPPTWKGLIERHCAVVLTPSVWCRELLLDLDLRTRLGRDIPIHVVPHGVDPEVFKPGGEIAQEEPRAVLRHFCSSPTMERKGTAELLRVARSLLQERVCDQDVNLLVSVHPEARPYAAAYAGVYPGGSIGVFEDSPSPQRSMARVLRGCMALVQPSRAEGFGCLGLEAVACGTPVVLVGQTGEAEYLSDLGGAALRVRTLGWASCSGGEAPVIDEKSLGDALLRVVMERDDLHKAALEVSRWVRERWSWSAIFDERLAPILSALV